MNLIWTPRDVPSGSVIGVLSDIHVPHHDEGAVRLAIECMEDAGVTHVILNGDILDCGPASPHERKRRRAMLDEGCLQESVAPGYWILEWARTRQAVFLFGNHERWVENLIAESPELKGTPSTTLLGIPSDGKGWRVLDSKSRVRFGNRAWEHGHMISPGGGVTICSRIRTKCPDRTTSVGHAHIKASTFWSTEDEMGISRTRGAFANGHLSKPEAHDDYAPLASWQQSFEITRVWYDGGRPRFSTDQPEIHRDKRGRPVFEYGGKVYR